MLLFYGQRFRESDVVAVQPLLLLVQLVVQISYQLILFDHLVVEPHDLHAQLLALVCLQLQPRVLVLQVAEPLYI